LRNCGDDHRAKWKAATHDRERAESPHASRPQRSLPLWQRGSLGTVTFEGDRAIFDATSRERGEREVPPEVDAHVMDEMQERHHRAWLDQPIPALRDLWYFQHLR